MESYGMVLRVRGNFGKYEEGPLCSWMVFRVWGLEWPTWA